MSTKIIGKDRKTKEPNQEEKEKSFKKEYIYEDQIPVIIDNGMYMVRAGFHRSSSPRAVFRTVVGRKRERVKVNLEKDCYVGEEAQSKRTILRITCPLENGLITNWNDMEKIWHHTFYNELRAAPEDHRVFLTHKMDDQEQELQTEKITEIMFETFNAPFLYISHPEKLSLVTSFWDTGISVDLGYSMTTIRAYHNWNPIKESSARNNLGGMHLTKYLRKLIWERGYSFNTLHAGIDISRNIKEQLCYVALDFEKERINASKSSEKKVYKLPDGEVFELGEETLRCPEALFQPFLLGLEEDGIHKLVHESIMKCEKGLWEKLYKNIFISGGSSMFGGLADRLQKEISDLAPQNMKVKVVAPPERKYSTWIGANFLISDSTFLNKWISNDEYKEKGPSIAHKFFL
ncbi:actin-7-related [Anaeramoeba flamelloides]|uniref:Actin-7-related n=1 Tax=Anaeramoeba flamelloides TaxID=1746091 RepID=A0AAV8A2V1_9EUKA|nr:actin-7-related [Anaeramoeba flamelloides]